MSILNTFRILFSIMGVFSLLSMGLLITLNFNRNELIFNQDIRYQSYQAADELRQSSDDLTRFARTFVVTQKSNFEKNYWEILDIRNGKEARPENYHQIYWDLVLDNDQRPRNKETKIALKQRMKDLGFTAEEFQKLSEAQRNSDKLVNTETIAMNAIKGQLDPKESLKPKFGETNREFAIRIMHDKDYHQEKKKIMEPVNEFFSILEKRTDQKVQDLKRTQEIIIYTLLFVMVCFLISLIVSFFIIQKKVSKPLYNLTRRDKVFERMGKGDLSVKAEVTSNDEVGSMLSEFNTMVSSQREMIRDVRDAIQQISESSLHMANLGSESNASVQLISENAREIQDLFSDQNKLLKELETSATQNSKKIQKNLSDFGEIERLSHTTKGISKEGRESIKIYSGELIRINDYIKASESKMDSMKTKSKSINNILEMLSEIADQTNLLALNAAIEAARAGEYGKGFTIVANEVSKLAAGSIQSSEKIKKLINELHKETEELGTSIQESRKAFQSESEKIYKIGHQFENINLHIIQLDEKISKLDTTMREMMQSNDSFMNTLSGILKTISHSNKNFSKIADALHTQVETSQGISSSSEELASVSESLKLHTKRFIV
jgi:methyl-accepting chemotaxis protein